MMFRGGQRDVDCDILEHAKNKYCWQFYFKFGNLFSYCNSEKMAIPFEGIFPLWGNWHGSFGDQIAKKMSYNSAIPNG
jgi:hypothetical protein